MIVNMKIYNKESKIYFHSSKSMIKCYNLLQDFSNIGANKKQVNIWE